jgi:hypothetical protein
MKQILLVISILLIALSIGVNTARAADESDNPAIGTQVLCLPGVYAVDPQDCQPLGPSSYLTRLADQGLHCIAAFARQCHLDYSYGLVPFNYAVFKKTAIPHMQH